MSPLDDKLRGALWGGILGDALASPLSGMSKGHIHSIFKDITGFTDPAPGLKSRESAWKKPGLYTAPSQLAILFSLLGDKARRDDGERELHIAAAAQSGGGTSGIFRHPDPLLLDMIQHCRARSEGRDQSRDPRIDLLPPLGLFLSLMTGRSRQGTPLLLDSLRLARFITLDNYAIAASAILVSILTELLEFPDRRVPVELLIDTAKNAHRAITESPASIFDLKLNPDTIAEKTAHVTASIELLNKADTPGQTERLICEHAMGHLKHNITRATVNHPLTIVPYALAFFTGYAENPREGFFAAAGEGGAAGTLASTAGILWGALHGAEAAPDELRDSLVNKTRMGRYVDAIAAGKTGAVSIKEFIDSEVGLTGKEREELQSRLRHVKVKEKKPKSSSDRERELNRHVVESWTKLDKAKWKKRDKDRYSE